MDRRNTIQKELVLRAVMTLHHHVTADEVYEFIRQEYPSIGKGTVYRNLGILTEQEKIRKVEIPQGPDRFDSVLQNHYHVRCMKCSNIFDVDMPEITGLTEQIRDPHGMIFLDYDILFKGICPDCQGNENQL